MQRARSRTLCEDTEANADLLVGQRLSLLEMHMVAYIVLELVVDVELVWVGIRLLGGSERIDLVGTDLKVLLWRVSQCHSYKLAL